MFPSNLAGTSQARYDNIRVTIGDKGIAVKESSLFHGTQERRPSF